MREESFPLDDKTAEELGRICADQLGSENGKEGRMNGSI